MSDGGSVYEGILSGEGLRFGVVVSRFNEFIGSRLDELGFTREDWEKYCKHGGSPQYALSAPIKKKIREVGAPEVLRLYVEEPGKLF